MKIIVDAMGGDLGSAEVVKGALNAAKTFGNELILVGDRDEIQKAMSEYPEEISGVQIVHADDVIKMTDDPMSVRTMPNSSMRVAIDLLAKGEGDALVSCGNTGALQTGATLYAKRIKGIHRAAIGAIMPMTCPVLLLDSGANVTVTPEYLYQFAVMGSIYMEKLYSLKSARVGLLNIGAEEKKGTPLQTETYKLLSESKNINFVGNIEGKDIPFGKCDVVITDGYTGNICLKSTEGAVAYLIGILKNIFKKSLRGKIAYLLIRKEMAGLKVQMDVKAHGGAPILGISHPVIKAHGNSDARAIESAIKQAITFSNAEIIDEITKKLSEHESGD